MCGAVWHWRDTKGTVVSSFSNSLPPPGTPSEYNGANLRMCSGLVAAGGSFHLSLGSKQWLIGQPPASFLSCPQSPLQRWWKRGGPWKRAEVLLLPRQLKGGWVCLHLPKQVSKSPFHLVCTDLPPLYRKNTYWLSATLYSVFWGLSRRSCNQSLAHFSKQWTKSINQWEAIKSYHTGAIKK